MNASSLCVSPGEDSVPAGGEERSGEPEERPGQKNKNVRIRFKTGKVRNGFQNWC